MPSAARVRKNKKDLKRKKRKRIIISALAIFSILVVYGVFHLNNMFNQMDQVELDDEDLGIDEEVAEDINLSNTNIINIALFGIDTRDNNYNNSLSDTIIIATVDFDHKKLKLTSIMRDTYANIPGKGYYKINSGYSYGGPSLAIKTINTNFDMNITDFATVNFNALEKMVDSIGGVQINIESYELSEFNRLIGVVNYELGGTPASTISSSGAHVLNGRQAVAYSRIRKVGQGDYERTERQRTVLEQILNSVLKERSISKAMNFVDSLLPYVQTSLTRGEILRIGTKIFTTNTTELVNTRIPTNDFVKNASINGASVVLPATLLDNVKYLHNFIYENDEYTPSDRLHEISYKISTYE